jgi:hypothetical protein
MRTKYGYDSEEIGPEGTLLSGPMPCVWVRLPAIRNESSGMAFWCGHNACEADFEFSGTFTWGRDSRLFKAGKFQPTLFDEL